MTHQSWLVAMLAASVALYTATAVAYHFNLRLGMTVVYIGYVIANVGMILDAVGK